MHGEEVPKGPVLKAVVVHEEAGGVQGAGPEEGPLEAWAYLYLGGLEGALPLPQGVWKG